MSDLSESIEFRKKQSLEIIAQYKDLITKYDALFDKDLLKKELAKIKDIDDEDKKAESEQKYLAKLKSRRVALEEKEAILEKIATLEKHLETDKEGVSDQQKSSGHPAKKYSRTT